MICSPHQQKERQDTIPEGPELRHSRDLLRHRILGKTVSSIEIMPEGRYRDKPPEGFEEIRDSLPLKIESIDVKGKFMWWTLTEKSTRWYMWSTYGMSGQWSFTQPKKHAGFRIDIGPSSAFFVDPRRFGTIKFTRNESQHSKKLLSLGPDVLEDPPLPPELFAQRILLKPNRTISEALMDQGCVSGIGNYLKAEALFRAGVSPHRHVVDMNAEEIEKLWSEVVLSCRESYADHGASIRTYKTVDGGKGSSQFYFRVYNSKTCPLGHEVVREETRDGRTSWWCRACQA